MPKRLAPDGSMDRLFVRRVQHEVDIYNHVGWCSQPRLVELSLQYHGTLRQGLQKLLRHQEDCNMSMGLWLTRNSTNVVMGR